MALNFDEFKLKADEFFSLGIEKLKEAIEFIEENSVEKAELRLSDAKEEFRKAMDLSSNFIKESGRKTIRISLEGIGRMVYATNEIMVDLVERLEKALKK